MYSQDTGLKVGGGFECGMFDGVSGVAWSRLRQDGWRV